MASISSGGRAKIVEMILDVRRQLLWLRELRPVTQAACSVAQRNQLLFSRDSLLAYIAVLRPYSIKCRGLIYPLLKPVPDRHS